MFGATGPSWPATVVTVPFCFTCCTAQPADLSCPSCHRSDNPLKVGDARVLSTESNRACGAKLTPGIAANRSSIGARSSARKVIAVTGFPLADARSPLSDAAVIVGAMGERRAATAAVSTGGTAAESRLTSVTTCCSMIGWPAASSTDGGAPVVGV